MSYQDQLNSLLPQQPSTSTGSTMPNSRQLFATKRKSELISFMDRCLKRYTTYMNSPLHQDRGLKFIQWTLWLFSYLVQKRNPTYSKHLRKLYLDVSFARYVTRFTAFPMALAAARSGSWTPYSAAFPKTMRWIGRVLSWSMIGYYPTEHIAYVQWMLPSAFSPTKRTAERWSYISCRFWLLYLIAECTQCVLQLKELSTSDTPSDVQDEHDNKLSKVDQKLAIKNSKVLLTRDLLFLLPCIQWSLPNWDAMPWLPESIINTLMWLESLLSVTLTS